MTEAVDILTSGVWHVQVLRTESLGGGLDDSLDDWCTTYAGVAIETRGDELALLFVPPDDRLDIAESLRLLGSAEISYRALRVFQIAPQLPRFQGSEFNLDVSDESGAYMLVIEPN